MHGLNMYDFHARQYDALLGRFHTMDPLAEIYYSISPYVYCANNPMRITDPTGMDWYLDEKSGQLYFNKNITDATTQYNDVQYTRVGGNEMMGDMKDVTEQAYGFSESAELAKVNDYVINPTEQVIEEASKTYSDSKSPAKIKTPTDYTVINEKYGIFKADESHQVTVKTDALGSDFEFVDFLLTVGGAANSKNSYRKSSTYLNADAYKKRGSPRETISIEVGGSKTEYKNWDSYKSSNPKGRLLKYKKTKYMIKRMKYIVYLIIGTALLLTGCISPEKRDFDGGIWRANDGATVYLNEDGSVIINQINWLNVVSGEINKGDFINITGKWKFITDFNNHKIIEISTDDRWGFEFCIKGQGIFENKRPFDLFIYIGDPDNMDRYIFKKISSE